MGDFLEADKSLFAAFLETFDLSGEFLEMRYRLFRYLSDIVWRLLIRREIFGERLETFKTRF